MHVLSLSSIPPRFALLQGTLRSLLAQRQPAEEIHLYIPRRYRRFPDWDGTLPEVPHGVRICRVAEDLGPATKVLYAAEALRGCDLGLIYCDDDRLYRPEWSRRLLRGWRDRPQATLCAAGFDLPWLDLPMPADSPLPRFRTRDGRFDPEYRWERSLQRLRGLVRPQLAAKPQRNPYRRSGHCHVAEGFGGVAIRPDWLPSEAWDLPPVMWTVDDVWLSGHLTRAGHAPWLVAGACRLRSSEAEARAPLFEAVIEGATRDQADRLCARHFIDRYGIWT